MRDVTSIVYFPNFISRTKIKSAMNNITDVTILIAVIALALWPIVLFLMRFMHERRKRLDHIERMTAGQYFHPETGDQCPEKNRMPARNQ